MRVPIHGWEKYQACRQRQMVIAIITVIMIVITMVVMMIVVIVGTMMITITISSTQGRTWSGRT